MKHILGVLLVFVFASATQGALVSVLGGQAVYDTDLNISWVGNANLAASNTFGLSTGVSLGTHSGDSSGVNGAINANGTMNWPGALFWIDAMNTANYLGASDWRLPDTLVPDSSCTNTPGTFTFFGGSGGLDCTGSEMGHLFHNEFNATPETSALATGTAAELAKFTNIQLSSYWSGTEFATNPALAWVFDFNFGFQFAGSKDDSHFFAWAVRDGDVGVAAVPVPAAVWLFGSALGLLGWMRRKTA